MSDQQLSYDSLSPAHKPAQRIAVPKEPMTAWQRWEMAAVQSRAAEALEQAAIDLAAPAPVLEQLQPALLIDEAELSRLRLEAQQAGAAEGRQQGYAQGREQGYAAGREVAQNEAGQLRALMLAMPVALRSAERALADDLLTLALDIARQVVRQAFCVEPQLLLATVRELLQTEPALSGAPRLLLHADDVALVKQYLEEDLQAAGWLVRTDPAITRGGCRVQAGSGELDATLETRWQRVSAALGRSAPASDD